MTADAPPRPEPQPAPRPRYDAEALAVRAARAARDRHAEDVIVLDLRGLSTIADYFVICSGTSDRQMRAVYDAIVADGAAMGCRPFGSAGHDSCTWMLVDFVDVVVHIFAPQYRRYYDLELLWGDAPHVDWNEQPHHEGTDEPRR
jgi:ribosome-associated protein